MRLEAFRGSALRAWRKPGATSSRRPHIVTRELSQPLAVQSEPQESHAASAASLGIKNSFSLDNTALNRITYDLDARKAWKRPISLSSRSARVFVRPSHTVNAQTRHFSQSLASRRETSSQKPSLAPEDDLVEAAFRPENIESYTNRKKTMSRKDAAVAYRYQGLGPLSASDLHIQEQLSQPDAKVSTLFGQAVKDSIISPHAMHLFLEAHFARIAKLPRRNRHLILEEQKQEGLARLVLAHCKYTTSPPLPPACLLILGRVVWSNEKLWAPLAIYDEVFLFRLSYYAILEGLSDSIIDWAFVNLTDDVSRLAGHGKLNVWRSNVLKSLIDAYCFRVEDNNADDVLTCMHRMVEKREVLVAEYQNSQVDNSTTTFDPSNVSLRPPGLSCSGMFRGLALGNTDGALYERHLQWWDSETRTTKYWFRREEDLADLPMYHPTKPSELPALKFLAHPMRLFDVNYREKKGLRHLGRFLQRACDLALRNNNPKNAEWIKDRFKHLLDSKTGRFAAPTKRDLAEREFELAEKARQRQDSRPKGYYTLSKPAERHTDD